MNKEDQAAFEEWADINNPDSDYWHPTAAWQAACAYKQKRITELEDEKAGYKKAAEYWKENYDRLIGRSEGGGEYENECIHCGLLFTGDKRDVVCNGCRIHPKEGGADE